MFEKKHLSIATYNLAILFAGIVIGSPVLSAQTPSFVEEVTPSISTGTAAFHTTIAHRVVADQVIVGDHDMGKLLENLINLMGRKSSASPLGATYTQAELQAVVDGSKLERPIRVKTPEPPQASKEVEKK